MVSKAIFGRLASTFSNRCYPHKQPPSQKNYPMCVYKEGEHLPVRTHDGNSNLYEQMVDIAIIAESHSSLQTVLVTVRGLLDVRQWTVNDVDVRKCYIDSDSESIDELRGLDRTYWVWEFQATFWISEE